MVAVGSFRRSQNEINRDRDGRKMAAALQHSDNRILHIYTLVPEFLQLVIHSVTKGTSIIVIKTAA